MKKEILIGSTNPHKIERLSWVISPNFQPLVIPNLVGVEERGKNFREIAENKAVDYSRIFNCLAVSTDGGAIIPGLSPWDPIRTRRFGENDQERIAKLLAMMSGKENRVIEWHEAFALADCGQLLFSCVARAMDGVLDEKFFPEKYQEGIWLCSITSFPQFEGRNFFDLTPEERALTEDSWLKLKEQFFDYVKSKED